MSRASEMVAAFRELVDVRMRPDHREVEQIRAWDKAYLANEALAAVADAGLAALLGEHRYRDVLGDYEVAPYYRHFGCSCGWEQDIAGMSGWESWRAAHEAHVAAVVRAHYEPEGEWEPGRWWRAVDPLGRVSAEASNEAEVRGMAREFDKVQRLWERDATEWRDDE